MSEGKPTSPREAFQHAVLQMQSGNAPTAERTCRDALRRDASDPNLHSLRGAALLRQDRAREAEQSLGRAIALAPGFAGA